MNSRVQALVELVSEEDVELGKERARELIEGAWTIHVEEWRAGRIFGPQGASVWCLEQLGLNANQELAGRLIEAIEESTTNSTTRVVDGAPAAVRAIRERGIATALICDTGFTPGRVVRRLLRDHGIELDHHFFSDEVGAPKPYPPIFKAALEATGSAPETAVHIGDLRRTDITGARNAGMSTIRFAGMHDDGWATEEITGDEADAVAHSWPEATDLLGV